MPKKRPSIREYYGGKSGKRPSAHERGYDARHRKWRQLILHRHPICTLCKRRAATVADHIIPLRAGGTWLIENGTGYCAECHNTKTHEDRMSYPDVY